MILQFIGDLHELLEAIRQILFQFGNRLGCTDTCYHVFALGIDQVFAVNTLRTRRRISGKSNAGAGSITHITEYHGLHVDCRAPIARNIIHTAVHDRSLIVPGTENCLDSFHQLFLRLLRELLTFILFIDIFKSGYDFFQIFCCQFRIKFDAFRFLDLVQNSLKIRLRNLHNDIGKHLYESPVGVISKSGIACLLRKSFYCHIRKTEIQDRIHHTGHGSPRTGTHRNKKRILSIAEFLTLLLLQSCKRFKYLPFDLVRDLPAAVVIISTSLCRNCKSLGDRQS